jgi:hypothetical protein
MAQPGGCIATNRVRIVITHVADDLEVLHRLVVGESQRAHRGVVDVELRRIAEQRLGQMIGVARDGIGFARAHGSGRRHEDRLLEIITWPRTSRE